MALITQKPNIRNAWATTGSLGSPSIDRILEGWVQEIPPSETANWVENRQDLALRYLFQEGFAGWDENFEYGEKSLTKYDGKVYIASAYNVGKQPDVETDIWTIAFDEYGASAAVQAIVEQILNDEGFLTLYVSKANPVMDGVAKAPAFQAAVGAPSTIKGENEVGHAFQDDDNTGLFRVGVTPNARLHLMKDGVTKALVPTGSEPLTSNDKTIVTTEHLKLALDELKLQMNALNEKTRVQVGASIITINSANPSTYLGYGTWELDCQGRAIVGLSSSTSPTIPEWVKIVDSEFGSYTHQQTIDEMPAHDHFLDGRYQDGGAGGVQAGNNSVSNVVRTKQTGGGNPFNIVQPSQTKFVYTRIG